MLPDTPVSSAWASWGATGMSGQNFRTLFLGEVDIPPAQRDVIAESRRRSFHALAPLAAVHSLLTAVVLTFAFWSAPAMPLGVRLVLRQRRPRLHPRP